MPASPPRFGAQARIHGLMTQLARRHDLTAVMLVDDEFDIEECRRSMQAYCREVVLVPNPYGREDLSKRLLQLRSLVSTRSFERLRVTVPATAAGPGPSSARQAVRRRQPGVLLPWPLRPAPGTARREAPGPGGGLPQHRLRAGQTVRPRRRQPGSSALRRRQLAQAAAGGARDLWRRRRGLPVQRGGRAAPARRRSRPPARP